MVPTIRLVRFIALGAPLWLLWIAFPMGWLGGTLYLGWLAIVCINDYRFVPDASNFELRRQYGRFSLGAVSSIRVSLVNNSRKLVHVVAKDELPAALESVTPIEPVDVPPRFEYQTTYDVRPIRRGRHKLGGMVLRVGRPGGLMQRDLMLPVEEDIKIYPRFATSDEYRLLARINQQDESVRRPRRTHGRGTDFESLSNYNPGDDLRTVDWKVSAKRGSLISRNLQTERGQQISVLIDSGRLMAEKIGLLSRFEYALNAAVMLSYVGQKRGDTVAMATFSDRIESFVPPVRGAAIMRRVLESLSGVDVRQVESDYWQVVGQVMSRLKRRSLVVMMTDVLDSAGSLGLMTNLMRAASRHLVLCVVLIEPRIAEIAASEPKTPREAYLKAAACHMLLQRQIALEKMRSRGILVLESPPEHLTVQLIRRYLEIRRANLQ
jgi:uncharacterized protein (DUF58 family)